MENSIDKYRIIASLGTQKKRKFGRVFLAENTLTLEQVVLKSNNKSSAKPNEIEQLRSEQYFSFESKGLPKVIDFYENENELFIVKNYQIGISLDQYWTTLKRKEHVSFIQQFVTQFCVLLNEIHSRKIYHCDLKPSNILIHGSKDQFEIELIDFGLAIQQPIIEKRKLLFPLGYAAPELLLNELELVNETTDYFSLGIILWRLFHDELPLIHPNPSIYTNLQLTHPLEDTGKLPKGLFQIIEKLTQKPRFKTSPNRIVHEEVINELIEAQKKRYQTTKALESDILRITPRKFLGIF